MNRMKPILVTGSHRSGTTWIGKTISQHPRVRYVHEPFNVNYPNKHMDLKINTWFTHYQSSNQKEEIKSAFNDLVKWNPLRYAKNICKIKGMDIKTPMRLCKHFISETFQRQRILVKDPIALLSAGWLHETYDFDVIVIIRNPFGVIGSLKKAGWDNDFSHFLKQKSLMHNELNQYYDNMVFMHERLDEYDLVDRAALLWCILHYAILKYQNRYHSWLFIKYEDIVLDPMSGFHDIFDYLGIELSGHILSYIENFTSSKNPAEAESTSYQPRNSKLILNTWKERLTNDEIERIKIATNHISSKLY